MPKGSTTPGNTLPPLKVLSGFPSKVAVPMKGSTAPASPLGRGSRATPGPPPSVPPPPVPPPPTTPVGRAASWWQLASTSVRARAGPPLELRPIMADPPWRSGLGARGHTQTPCARGQWLHGSPALLFRGVVAACSAVEPPGATSQLRQAPAGGGHRGGPLGARAAGPRRRRDGGKRAPGHPRDDARRGEADRARAHRGRGGDGRACPEQQPRPVRGPPQDRRSPRYGAGHPLSRLAARAAPAPLGADDARAGRAPPAAVVQLARGPGVRHRAGAGGAAAGAQALPRRAHQDV